MAIRAYNPINGTDASDTINGTSLADFITGGKGADTLYGNGNDDILSGGIDGKVDKLYGGEGVDVAYYGGVGRDMTIDLNTNTGAGYAKLNEADVQTDFNGRPITLHFAEVMEDELYNIENVTAGNGNDLILGNSGDNRLFGGDGNDVIDGKGGADVLIGGQGTDTLTGGGGADTFVFQSLTDLDGQGTDQITDFTRGSDKIDLSAIDADTTLAGDQAFHLVNSGFTWGLDDDGHLGVQYVVGFTGHAGELTRSPFPGIFGDVYIADVNGDAVADMGFFVRTDGTLTSSDFLL
jgi:serralysin